MRFLSPRSIALGICLFLFGLAAWIVTVHYQTFFYTGLDLALYGQLMWNLCHGSVSTSLFNCHFLIDHANYIAFLLVPFYFFFQGALTLLYIKLIAFFAGAYLLFRITERKLNGKWAVLFMLGYLSFPSNITMLFFEFNFENLALPLIFLAFFLLEQKRFISFMLTCLTLCLVKENMPPVAFMFGIYAFFFYKKENPLIARLTPYLLLSTGAVFILHVFIIQPALTKGLSFHQSNYWEFYKPLGTTPPDILKNLILDPGKTASLLFNTKSLFFLKDLFGPLIIPSILSPHVLFLGLPLFLQNLLSTSAGQQSIFFYYASTLAVFVFLSSIHSLSRIKKENRERLLIIVIGSLFIFNLCYIQEWKKRLPSKGNNTSLYHQSLSKIPPDAGVVSSMCFLPMLSQRKDLYPLGRNIVPFTRKKEHLPGSINHLLMRLPIPAGQSRSIRDLALSPGWSVDTATDDIVLLKKNMPNRNPLVQLGALSVKNTKPLLLLDPFIELISLDLPTKIHPGTTTLSITTHWRALHDLSSGSKISFILRQGKERLWENSHPIAYGFPMERTEEATETFNFTIPPLPTGEYTLSIWLVKDNTLDWKWSNTITRTLKVDRP